MKLDYCRGFILCFAFGWGVFPSGSWAQDAKSAESRLLDRVKFLADDEREGRGVGTKGLNSAAEYIAAEFAKLGLKTNLFDGSPFQTFEVVTDSRLGPADHNRLVLTGPPGRDGQPQRIEFSLGSDFNPLTLGGSNKASAGVVFVGYGISSREHNYDDYAGIDVKDKVVVMLRKEPQQGDEQSIFAGKNTTSHATFEAKVSNAYQRGAAAVILVNDAYSGGVERGERQKQWTETLDKLESERARFREKSQPDDAEWKSHREAVSKLASRLSELNQQLSGESDQLLAPDGAGYSSGTRKISVLFAKRARVDEMLQAALGNNVSQIEARIDEKLQPLSAPLEGWRAEVETSVEHVRSATKNVIAVLEGNGPLADETLIVGAHYDHLGTGGREIGSLAPWTREIHNGADDNASGTAALLEIARTLASQPRSNSRRIVFAAFTGEERGLLGSRQYAQDPPFPLERTVAMVNLDMVGRLNENKLIVYGTGTSSGFDALVDEVNKKYSFDLRKDPGGDGPSDHQTFYRKNIPVFHFFTGSHSDYHRPTDDVERINVAGMRQVTEFVTDVVERLARVSTRPDYVVVQSRSKFAGGDRPRPSLGTMPDYGANVEGCRLEFIREGGPADLAGLKAGDIITRLGENKIGSVEDYDSALRKFQPGDTIKIGVLRGDKPIEVQATLGRPR